MTMRLQPEPVHELWQEAEPLLKAAFEAYEPMPELPLEIDRECYERIEQIGLLRVYTARAASGALLGYAVFILGPSVRRRGLWQAQQDVLHTAPGAGARVSVALIGYAEERLREDGVKLVYHSAPRGHALGRLLERLGYRPTWEAYVKQL